MTEKEKLNALIGKHDRIILFGASQTGEACLREISAENQKHILGFTDNNALKEKDVDLPFFSVSEIVSSNAKIFITSNGWKSIYEQLVSIIEPDRIIGIFAKGFVLELNKFFNNGWERNKWTEQVILAGEDRFQIRYRNEAHVNMDKLLWKEIKGRIENIKRTGDLYTNLWEVDIELSNLCNYSRMHPKCPVSKSKEKHILSSKVVYQLLDELSEINFKGILRFGTYNEVLMDPRLFMFMEYAKRNIEHAVICIYSNGFYLNDVIVSELENVGMDELTVTAYGEQEWKRLRQLQVNVPYKILMCNSPKDLDDRICFYDKPYNMNSSPCMEDMIFYIDSSEHLRMCCLDWRSEQYREFGKISDHSIKEWANDRRLLNNILELAEGKRKCDLCRRCDWPTWSWIL